jgi:hypothetical protein
MIGIYIRITESQREVEPPSYNQFPLSIIGRYTLSMRGIKGARLINGLISGALLK